MNRVDRDIMGPFVITKVNDNGTLQLPMPQALI